MGVVTAAVAGAVVAGGLSYAASKKSAGAAKSATNATIDAQERQAEQTRADTAHLRDLSQRAVGTINKLNTGDMSSFYTSPDYQFNVEQGQKGIDRSLAARGGALSGAGVREGIRYSSGLASREYGGYVDRLMQQAGLGNTGIGASAAAGTNAANNISSAYMAGGAARGSAYIQTGEGINNAIQGGISNYMLSNYLSGGGNQLQYQTPSVKRINGY